MGGPAPNATGVLDNPADFRSAERASLWVSVGVTASRHSSSTWFATDLDLDNRRGALASRNTYFDVADRLGYVVGGTVGGISTGSFLTYDGNDAKWSNSTLPWGVTDGDGAMGSFRIGNRVLLVYVGGTINGVRLPLDKAQIFDSVTNTWYTQSLSGVRGQIPSPRTHTCVTNVAAPDNSSYQMLMFGGAMDNEERTVLSDLWALNIPSFEWVLLDDSLARPDRRAPGRTYAPSCHVIMGNTLVVYGGKKSGTVESSPSCERFGDAGYFMNLNNLTWLDRYEAKQVEYQIPNKIQEAIGGGPQGGATLMAPKGGFADPVLATIFSSVAATTGSPTTTGTGNGETKTPENTPSPSAPIAAIIGAVLGALLLLTIGIIGFVCLRKRKARINKQGRLSKQGRPMFWPIGGRNELPALPDHLNYREQLELQKNYNESSNTSYNSGAATLSYELPAEPVHYELSTSNPFSPPSTPRQELEGSPSQSPSPPRASSIRTQPTYSSPPLPPSVPPRTLPEIRRNMR
ncbi:hypothetical protein ABW20_dc0108103 [Dactylellina cionopaga]|nr:hypothetical protein ABW20_dc0108103 [Dactylellina cionopaga]